MLGVQRSGEQGLGWRGLATRALCPDGMTQSLQAPETGGSQEERGEETLQRRGSKRNVLFSAHVRSGSFLFCCSPVILLPFPGEFNPVSSFCACIHTQMHRHTHTDTQKHTHRPSDTDTNRLHTNADPPAHIHIHRPPPNTHTQTLSPRGGLCSSSQDGCFCLSCCFWGSCPAPQQVMVCSHWSSRK